MTLDTVTISRIIEQLIDELDRRSGDPDLEPDDDRCAAGDDGVFSGLVFLHASATRWPGSDDEGCI